MVKEKVNNQNLPNNANHIKELKKDIVDFIHFFNDLGINTRNQLSDQDLLEYRIYLIDKRLDKKLIDQKISRLKQIFFN